MRLTNTNHFFIDPKKRFLHLATIQKGSETFFLFRDTQEHWKFYIERVVGGLLEFISDDVLAWDLQKFCEEQGLLSLERN